MLVKLASINSVEAFRTIERYLKEPNHSLRDWAKLAFQESKLLLESKLLDENQVLISTGLGGKGMKLRYFTVILSDTGENLTKIQKKIINSELGSGLQIDGIGDLKIGFEKKSESKNDDEYETEKKYEVGNISMWKDKSFDLDSEETYYNARIWSFASKWDGFINISIEMKYSWNVNREYPCGAHIFYETNAILYANQWDIIKFKTEYFDAI